MMARRTDTTSSAPLRLTFYVAGDGLYSRQALANLDALIAELGRTVELDIVDVRLHPEAALAESIFATPALIVATGTSRLRFIGDLSQREKVLQSLQS